MWEKEERSMKEKEKAVISDGTPKLEELGKNELRTLCTALLKAILDKRTKNENK